MSQTVLIIKDEEILAVSGKCGKSAQLHRLEREDISGFGDPFVRWEEAIAALSARIDLSQVRLVLPASMCSASTIRLPYVKNQKALTEMAFNELEETFHRDIMDYAVINNDKKAGALLVGASVEEKRVGQFLEMCGRQKIQVTSVTAPLESLLRLVRRLEAVRSQTAIFLFFEDGAVTSVLSEMGTYKYSSRSRIFSEPGTLDFGTEVVRNVSGILQFQAASKSEYTITQVYYTGCDHDVFEVSREGLENMNLTVSPMGMVQGVSLPVGQSQVQWQSCIGAMLSGVRGVKDLDLLAVYRQSRKEENAPAKGGWKHLIPTVAAALLCGAVYGGVLLINHHVQGQIDDVNAWMESETVQKSDRQAKKLDEALAEVQKDINQVQENSRYLATYPSLEQSVTDRIGQAGGEKITSRISGYDSGTGEMTFEARSPEAIDIPAYIIRLTDTGLFTAVDYTGYEYEDNGYTLFLLCTMKGTDEEGAGQ